MAASRATRTAHSIAERERTSDVLTEENSNVDFASMFLSDPVTEGLQKVGFEKPSPIQLKAIPLGRCGLDLIVQAKSGTGKTCVFTVIALESLDLNSPTTQVLVLAPTREIAVQIQETFLAIGCEMKGLRCHVFIGGTLFGPDRQKLKKCHVAVGTPGRIKQLIEYDVLKMGSVRLFVLDEADKLLEENFQEQINWIYNRLPDNKQMLALSATYPEYLAKHLTKYMREPTFVRLNPRDLALKGIKQLYVELPGHSLPNKAFEIKVVKLLTILTQVSFNQCLIFSNLQTRAQNLCDILCDRGWPSECISGSQEQSHRLSAMAKLKKFQCRILISTDLTARGIDAENVNLIINLDIPTDSKTYLHRIGRAGRFGTHGAAISLASRGREVELLRNIQRHCRVQMKELPDPAPSDLLRQDLGDDVVYLSIDTAASDPGEPKERISDRHESSRKIKENNECDALQGITAEDSVSLIKTNDKCLDAVSDKAGEDASTLAGTNGESSSVFKTNDKSSEKVFRKMVDPSSKVCALEASPNEQQSASVKADRSAALEQTAGDAPRKMEPSASKTNTRKKPLVARKCRTPLMVEAGVQTDEKIANSPKEIAQASPQKMSQDMTNNLRLPETLSFQQRRPVLPLGFEDAPEVLKLRLPQMSQLKASGDRRAWSFLDAKKSCEEFLKKKASVKQDKHSDDATRSGRESPTIGTTVECSTPLKEIQLYRALMADLFIRDNRTCAAISGRQAQVEDELDRLGHEKCKKVEGSVNDLQGSKGPQRDADTGKVEVDKQPETLVQNGTEGIVEKTLSETSLNGKKDSLPDEVIFSRKDDFAASEENIDESGTQSERSSSNERKNRDEGSNVGQEGHALPKVSVVQKQVKESTKVVPKKQGRQRIKEHVFTRSTLGALVSHEQLNSVISKTQRGLNQVSVQLPQTEPETESLSKVDNVSPNAEAPPKPENKEEGQLSNGFMDGRVQTGSVLQTTGTLSTLQKQDSGSPVKTSDSSRSGVDSSAGDPIWAIFKGFITRTSADKEKENKEKEISSQSQDSSSSFCESHTSTSNTRKKRTMKESSHSLVSSSSFCESGTSTTSNRRYKTVPETNLSTSSSSLCESDTSTTSGRAKKKGIPGEESSDSSGSFCESDTTTSSTDSEDEDDVESENDEGEDEDYEEQDGYEEERVTPGRNGSHSMINKRPGCLSEATSLHCRVQSETKGQRKNVLRSKKSSLIGSEQPTQDSDPYQQESTKEGEFSQWGSYIPTQVAGSDWHAGNSNTNYSDSQYQWGLGQQGTYDYNSEANGWDYYNNGQTPYHGAVYYGGETGPYYGAQTSLQGEWYPPVYEGGDHTSMINSGYWSYGQSASPSQPTIPSMYYQ